MKPPFAGGRVSGCASLSRLSLACAVLLSAAVGSAQTGFVVGPALDLDVLDPEATSVTELEPLPDGKLLLAGRFIYINGVRAGSLVRLNPDHTLDPSFGPVEVDGTIAQITLGVDGRIYVA